jgi:hypothetical protein
VGAIRAVGGIKDANVPKNTVMNNLPKDGIWLAFEGLPLLNKFIICLSQIAEFDPAQPTIPN